MDAPRYQLEFVNDVRQQVERLPGHIYPRIKRIITAFASQPRPKTAARQGGAL